MLRRVIYTSRASGQPSSENLSAILDTARAHNRAAGITGVLVYCDGRFLQLLEGGETEVEALLSRIRRDPRHTALCNLHDAPAARRQFSGWSMAFHHPGDALADHQPLDPDVALTADEILNPPLAEPVLARLSARLTARAA